MHATPLAIAAALLAASPAIAGPDRLSILLGSHHIGANRDFEEFNPGIALTWDRGLDYSISAYRNSYGKLSVAGTVAYPFYETETIGFSAFAGIANYPEDGRRIAGIAGDLVPLVGLRARYRNAFIQFLPTPDSEADGVFSFGVSLDLDER